MSIRHLPLCALCALGAAVSLAAQESVRDLDRPGEHHKHLTVDTVDRWLFDGEADEVLRVDVSSNEFDPVISLVRLGPDGQVESDVVPDVDEPGSRSRLLARLAADGRFAILVHGAENRGGGNYRLHVERLRSVPLPEGAAHVDGILDEAGRAHVRFLAEPGETVVPFGAGVTELIDPMGHGLPEWSGCYDVVHEGEHYARVQGAPGAAFRLGVGRARRRQLEDGARQEERLPAHGLDEWIFTGAVDDFRTLTVHGGRVAVRITPYGDAPSGGLDDRPALRWLPTHQKGDALRFAFVLGRRQSYRVQIRSTAPDAVPYRLRFGDTCEVIGPGMPLERRLPIGGAEFVAFRAEPGQVLRVDVESDAFDPVVRLTTASGAPFGENDDGGQGLACRHGWLVTSGGTVRAQVASFGDGGGGAFRVGLTDVPVPDLPVGATRKGTIGEGTSEHWHLDGVAGRSLFLSARSASADMALTLFDPHGVVIGKDENSGTGRDALLAIRLPRDGRYTIEVWTRSGRGDYLVQAIDPDGLR